MNNKVKEYLWRAGELKRLDPVAFEVIKQRHIAEFGDHPTNRSVVSDDDRCMFWLHWLADWRVARLKEESAAEARAQKAPSPGPVVHFAGAFQAASVGSGSHISLLLGKGV